MPPIRTSTRCPRSPNTVLGWSQCPVPKHRFGMKCSQKLFWYGVTCTVLFTNTVLRWNHIFPMFPNAASGWNHMSCSHKKHILGSNHIFPIFPIMFPMLPTDSPYFPDRPCFQTTVLGSNHIFPTSMFSITVWGRSPLCSQRTPIFSRSTIQFGMLPRRPTETRRRSVDFCSAIVVTANCYLPRLCFAFGRLRPPAGHGTWDGGTGRRF